jgi:hypothetical protein
MEPEGQLLPGGGRLPLGGIRSDPLLGQLPDRHAAGPRVDPHAPANIGLDGREESPGIALGGEAKSGRRGAAVVPVAGFVEPPRCRTLPNGRLVACRYLIEIGTQAGSVNG